jgi:hypothetical protein
VPRVGETEIRVAMRVRSGGEEREQQNNTEGERSTLLQELPFAQVRLVHDEQRSRRQLQQSTLQTIFLWEISKTRE